MPLQKLQLRPGVNRESTTLANEGGWFDCDKIRFRSGYPQKIGGWAPLSSSTYAGVARSLWNWVTLKGYNLLGVGTNLKYYIESGGTYNDITPIRVTTTLPNNPFTTLNTFPTVTVNAPGHGANNGDYVTFSGATAVGGLTLNNEYVITYINSNSYSITASSNATSTATGGGAAVSAAYQLNTGASTITYQTGWGAGLWGGYAFGTATTLLNGTINSSVTTIVVNSTTGFAATGRILIDSELITYSGKTGTDFTGCTRGALGTTAAAHTTGASVFDAATFTGWGQSVSTTTYSQIRLWSEANFGEYLLINPSNGPIYLWIPSYNVSGNLTFTNRAELLSSSGAGAYDTDADCPTIASFITVSDASRFVIAFGVNGYTTDPNPTQQDPMLIRWSDQESYQVWTPAITNQAGSFRLSSGSYIVAQQQTRQEILVWTDAALYSMQYLGPPFVWGFNILADNISIISPNAVATANNVTYWMGLDKFYAYSGRVETLPCSLRQYVFGDINTTQSSQFFAGTNEGYSEVWWYYCSANSTVVDRYVIYNYLDQVWYYGTLGRTAWLDSPLRNFPMAATYSNNIVFHEDGVDDITTTGNILPITSYIQSSDFDIGDGHNYGFVWRMIPDITFDGSTTPAPNTPQVTFTVRPRQNPGSPYGTADTPTVASDQSYANQRNYTVQEFTPIVYTRLRGRQMAFKIISDTVGTQWQLGVPRIDVRPDGRR
jgi:hypothetical protein